MPNLHLTDLSVRALKGSEKYVTFWDTTTPGFGVRVGKRSKTWTVMRGRQRERVSIGQYGAVSLSDARKEAMRLLSELTDAAAPKPIAISVREARSEFLTENFRGSESRWPHLVALMLDRHCMAIDHKQLPDVTDDDVRRILDRLQSALSAQLHLYRVLRTFFKWCTRPPHRYLSVSPMEGYPPPGRDRKGSRVLTDEELKAVWNASGSGSRVILRLMILWGTRNEDPR